MDFAQLIKMYGADPDPERRYSPAKCIGWRMGVIQGAPDPIHVSTSYYAVLDRSSIKSTLGRR